MILPAMISMYFLRQKNNSLKELSSVSDRTQFLFSIVSLTDYARSLQKKYEEVSDQMGLLFYQGFTHEEL